MLYINDFYKEIDRMFKRKERTKQHFRDCLNMFKQTHDIWWYNQASVWLRCAIKDEYIIKKTLENMYIESRYNKL